MNISLPHRRSSLPAVLVLSIATLSACRPPSADLPPDGDAPSTAGDGDGDLGGDDAPHAKPPRPVIYQLVPRTFSNTNPTRAFAGTLEQNGVGKFDDLSAAALTSLRDLGITHVWLTGVLRQATLTDYGALGLPADDPDIVKGRAGSFYAVRDYFDVCPDYATNPARRREEFGALVDRIHAAGMKVIIDLVPNHTARSYASVVHPELDFGKDDDKTVFFSPQNDYFYLVSPPGQALHLERPASWNPEGVAFDGAFASEDGTSAERVPRATGDNGTSPSPGVNSWYETIKLNYGASFVDDQRLFEPIPSTWTKVDAILAYWQGLGVDGFRCDFAHWVPQEAWRYLIDRARERDAQVFFFAEAYEALNELLDAGFDAVYHDAAYDALKRIYQGTGTQADLDHTMGALDDPRRGRYLHYLENHDERRVASPIIVSNEPNDSGFGSAAAAYQLAPLLYLYGQGPLLLYNGQEVGEPAEGAEGFGGDDGRTSIFDYWSMPELAKWVGDHTYDGAALSEAQRRLRAYYGDLIALSQEQVALGERYWGLEYHNHSGNFADCPDGLYSFARFATAGGRLLVVVANFTPGQRTSGRIRIPAALADEAALPASVSVVLRLNEAGATRSDVATLTRAQLVSEGFAVTVENQAAAVFEVF